MKYIKNLEDKTQSVLAEDVAADAAELSGLDADAVSDAVDSLNFASYLELGNAITNQDGELIRELLNISDIVPNEPIADVGSIEEDRYEDETDECIACSQPGYQSGLNLYGETCLNCAGRGRVRKDGSYIDDEWEEKIYSLDQADLEEEKLLDKPTPTLKDLVKKHNVSLHDIGVQLAKGIKAEKEHTTDMLVAKEIALDHLSELPDYYDRLEKMEEADNPSAPAVASPAQQAATPPSAGSSIDALAQPADTATEVDDQEIQQARKEIDDLQIGDEIEVADIDGQPAAGRVRNLAGPGDTLVITGKGNEEHMVRKDSILSTPMLPVQEKKQARLDKSHLGKKNKRAERVEDKKKKDIYEIDTDAMREAYEKALESDQGALNDRYDDETLNCKHCGDYFCTSKFGGECPGIQKDMFGDDEIEESYGEETFDEMVDYWKTSLSQSIVRKGVFTQLYDAANKDIEELNAAIAEEAYSIAETYHGGGEGIGSSDQNNFIASIGHSLGIDDLFGWNKQRGPHPKDSSWPHPLGEDDSAEEFKRDLQNPQWRERSRDEKAKRKVHLAKNKVDDLHMARVKTSRGTGTVYSINNLEPTDPSFPHPTVSVRLDSDPGPYGGGQQQIRFKLSDVEVLPDEIEEEINEGSDFHFFIDPLKVGANVMNSNGDNHGYYPSEGEALSVAKKLNAQYGEVDEGKYNYPQRMKGKGGATQQQNPAGQGKKSQKGAKNRKQRKAFRKAQRAEQHAARMRGEVDEEFEHYGSGTDFIPVTFNGREIGTVWQEGEGDWHAEFNKTGSSWGMIDSYIDAVNLLHDEAGLDPVDEDISRLRELAGIKETASGGATGAGAIASSPSAMNGVQKRNPSIYGQTKLKKKPTPKTRLTKEAASAGIGRNKKDQ